LSDQRSASVVDYLVQMGVGRDRLTSQGFGMMRPVGPNITAAGRARNRRVGHILERCPATTP
jgi:OOP family OmpA-OmpF porin